MWSNTTKKLGCFSIAFVFIIFACTKKEDSKDNKSAKKSANSSEVEWSGPWALIDDKYHLYKSDKDELGLLAKAEKSDALLAIKDSPVNFLTNLFHWLWDHLLKHLVMRVEALLLRPFL